MKGVPEGSGRVVLGSFYVPGYALPLTFDQGTAIRGFVEALSGMGSVVVQIRDDEMGSRI